MKKIIFSAVLISTFVNAQKKEQDSLNTRTIEDVKLHKTGNPNKAKLFTTKSNLNPMETPQAIAVVTHEVIEQQQAQQLSDVVRNVNGVYLTSARGSSQDNFGARGYTFGNENIFKNGNRINSGIFPEVSGLERVEVLKGSAAILYGNVAPGGIVNMVTKKPLFNFGGNVALNYGSWNNIKPTVDVYGALTKNSAFRVNGSYEYKDSFRDVVNSKKHYFNPSFLFNISDKTQIIIEADYLKHHFTPDFGLGSIMDQQTGISSFDTGLSRNAFIGANWQYNIAQMATSTITVNHQINSNWNFSSVASYQNYTKDYYSTERIQWLVNTTNDAVNPERSFYQSINRTYNEQNYGALQFNLNGEFKTGKIKHKLLTGADADYNKADAYTFTNSDGKKSFPFNNTSVTYLDRPETWNNVEQMETIKKDVTSIPTQRFGAYIQDLVDFGKIKLLAGVRFNYLETKDRTVKNFANNSETKSGVNKLVERAFSPRFGLVYEINDKMMAFASYANSFTPNNTGSNTDIQGNPLESSMIDQYEVGLKTNIIKNTLSLNLTAYQIDNDNLASTAMYDKDGNINNNTNLKILGGKARSRGAELDITGNPTPNLSLVGGVSYNHAEYVKTPDTKGSFVEGERIVRTPAVTANASIFYTLPQYVKGLRLGVTAFYTGDRLAGWNNTKYPATNQQNRIVKLKDFTTLDFSVGYQFKKLSIMGKVGNLFDVVDYNVHENYSVNPITPRNFYVTLNYKL